MKFTKATQDDIFAAACRGHVHLWRDTKDTSIHTVVPLWDGTLIPFGQLEAVHHSKASDVYWCRYVFDGIDLRDMKGPAKWDLDGETDWFFSTADAAKRGK